MLLAMPAARHIHPEQLAMFMPAHAIAALDLGDADNQWPAGKARLLAHKQDENTDNKPYWGGGETRKAVYDREGVQEPLEIAHRRRLTVSGYNDKGRTYEAHDSTNLDEGHHRLAWAMNKNPKTELPVQHYSYGHD